MSTASDAIFLFVGPTGAKLDLGSFAIPSLSILPPARRGDIDRLTRSSHRPGVIALVDGTYFSHPAVGHLELRKALETGWEVWGLSSMGAIRAYEMRLLGMRGFGRIYEEFFKQDDFQDDEVALLHSSQSPYLQISEPLFHIRALIRELVEEGRLNPSSADCIIAELKASWFGNRTVPKVCSLLNFHQCSPHSLTSSGVESLMRKHRIKHRDLSDFLTEKPWLKE